MKWHTQGNDGLNGWQTHRGNETQRNPDSLKRQLNNDSHRENVLSSW